MEEVNERVEDFIDWQPARVMENNDSGVFRFEAVVSEADHLNRNRRMYPVSVLFPAFEALNRKLEERPGLVDHPGFFDGPSVSNIGIRWEGFYFEGKKVIGRGRIVPTQKGKDLQATIEAGIAVGFSTRGYGTSEEIDHEDGSKVKRMTKFDLETVDAVTDPSVYHARTRHYTKEETEQMDSELRETKEALAVAQTRIAALESEITSNREAHTSLLGEAQGALVTAQARIKELESELEVVRQVEAVTALKNKLHELTVTHRFGATIRTEVEALQASGIAVTLENVEAVVARFTALVEAAATAANEGGNPRGDLSTDEDAVQTKDKGQNSLSLDAALGALLS